MSAPFTRAEIFPEGSPPESGAYIERGRALARSVGVGPSAFLKAYGAESEAAYKRRRADEGALMLHAQIGYRDPDKSRRAWAEIHGALDKAGGRLDRYGICLDWSMGYPRTERTEGRRGTGLILAEPEDFAALTAEAPVAPHFGDFVIGLPAALENTAAALAAGATTIGNLGQYFTFRLPGWPDDIRTTGATLEALALCAAQPIEILIHSNLDDGFAALFCDLACAFGAVLLERHIVEELLGGSMAHCYGHSFSDPLTRLAFQRALSLMPGAPGSMIYGNTVAYREDRSGNYAALGSYLMVDAVGQRLAPTGHALNPVPVSEAERIPDIDEVIDAQLFALRLIERSETFAPLVDCGAADEIARRLLDGGEAFKQRVLAGLAAAGIEVDEPFELLLALRRIGAKRLEEAFGPGSPEPSQPRSRRPLVKATTIAELERQAEDSVTALKGAQRDAIAGAGLTACVASTDVHEYGKILIEEIFKRLGVSLADAGVHAEAGDLAALARDGGADLIAVSTYNGVALDYLTALQKELAARALDLPVLIGGKLNQIPDQSNSSLPRDVTREIQARGAVACQGPDALFAVLLRLAGQDQ